MDANLLLGAGGIAGTAFGVWGLMLRWEKRKNGHGSHDPELAPQMLMQSEIAQSVRELPNQIHQGLQPVINGLTHLMLETQAKPAPEAPPSPAWPPELVTTFERLTARLEEPPLPAAWPPGLAASLDRISDRLEALLQMGPPPPVELDPLVAELSRGLAQLPGRFSVEMGEMLAAERKRRESAAPAGNIQTAKGGFNGGGETGAGGGANPPVRRAPPGNLPRIPPGALPVMPQIPASYVGGSVYVPAGEVTNLLVLIQLQLSPNCPGTSAEFSISTEDGPVFVGAASRLGGPLSANNYAYQLVPDSPPRIYRSSYPGNNTPIGELQVLAPSGGWLHIEVQS